MSTETVTVKGLAIEVDFDYRKGVRGGPWSPPEPGTFEINKVRWSHSGKPVSQYVFNRFESEIMGQLEQKRAEHAVEQEIARREGER